MAKRYAAWLSEKAGRTYRLLSESEWEYVARAGTTTPYIYGSNPDDFENRIRYFPTNIALAPLLVAVNAAGYPPNDFGLYHVHGNVSEWVEDCWHDDYTDAPTDGSAWTTNCSSNRLNNYVNRGGSGEDRIANVRSASRASATRDSRGTTGTEGASSEYLGFRIVRDLP